LQQIVSQLIFQGKENIPVAEISPWLDLRFPPKEEKFKLLEQQKHRRMIKTHLPADALPISNKAKYIYIARDGRDVVWSMYDHYSKGNDLMYDMLNSNDELPTFRRPSGTKNEYFRDWLEQDGYPIWSCWDNIKTWWGIREQKNVKLLHYNELKKDLEGSILEIASFLEITVDSVIFPKILEHCSFNYMKNNGDTIVPLGGKLWKNGSQDFINKGINQRWKNELSYGLSLEYEEVARSKLGDNCYQWFSQR
jgi:aryl sulfotransferase